MDSHAADSSLARGLLDACSAVFQHIPPSDADAMTVLLASVGLGAPTTPQGCVRSQPFKPLFKKAEMQLDAGKFAESIQSSCECLAQAAPHLASNRPVREEALKPALHALEVGQASKAAWAGWPGLAVARFLLAKRRPVAAIARAEEAAALFRRNNDIRAEAVLQSVIVDSHVMSASLVDSTYRQSHYLKMTEAEVREALNKQRAVHFNDALKVAIPAVALFSQSKDKRAKADLLCTTAEIHFGLGNLDDSKEACMCARDLYHDLQDAKGEQSALMLELEAHIADQDATEALDVGREIAKVFKKLKDTRGEAQGLYVTMKVHILTGQFDQMLKASQDIRALCKSDGNFKMEGQVMEEVMRCHLNNNRLDDASRAAEDAQEIYRKASDKRGQATALHASACLQFDAFFKGLEEKIADFKKKGCWEQYYEDYNMKPYDEAIAMLDKAIGFFKDEGDSQGQAMAEETLQASQRRAAMLNEPDETKHIIKDGKVIDVVKIWNPPNMAKSIMNK